MGSLVVLIFFYKHDVSTRRSLSAIILFRPIDDNVLKHGGNPPLPDKGLSGGPLPGVEFFCPKIIAIRNHTLRSWILPSPANHNEGWPQKIPKHNASITIDEKPASKKQHRCGQSCSRGIHPLEKGESANRKCRRYDRFPLARFHILNIKPEEHHITIFHNIIFTFLAHFTSLFCCFLRSQV